jgi:hypothetical protein
MHVYRPSLNSMLTYALSHTGHNREEAIHVARMLVDSLEGKHAVCAFQYLDVQADDALELHVAVGQPG